MQGKPDDVKAKWKFYSKRAVKGKLEIIVHKNRWPYKHHFQNFWSMSRNSSNFWIQKAERKKKAKAEQAALNAGVKWHKKAEETPRVGLHELYPINYTV